MSSFSCHYYYFKLFNHILSCSIFSFPVFPDFFVGLVKMSMSSAMDSEQASSMSSQQKQQIEQMRAMMATDSSTVVIVITMVITLVIVTASKFLLCISFWLLQDVFNKNELPEISLL